MLPAVIDGILKYPFLFVTNPLPLKIMAASDKGVLFLVVIVPQTLMLS